MKKIIIIIILFLLIPFTVFTILDLKDKDIYLDEDFITTETENSYIVLNNNTLNDVFFSNLFDTVQLTLDTSIRDFNDLTLQEVFETSLFDNYQLVTNGDFETATLINWAFEGGGTKTIISDIKYGNYALEITTNNSSGLVYQIISAKTNDEIYYSVNTYLRSFTTNSIILGISDSGFTNYTNIPRNNSTIGTWLRQSQIITNIANDNPIFILGLVSNATRSIIYDNINIFNITKMKANNQYSPLYQTTFDLMTDEQIKLQMDEFLEKPYLFIDYENLGFGLTTSKMDFYYSLYQALKNNVSLPNEISNGFYTNGNVIIYLAPLIINKQYSPLYQTTFDLMTIEQIKLQMDEFVAKPYLFIDYENLGFELSTSQMDRWYNYYSNGYTSIITLGGTVDGYTNLQNFIALDPGPLYKLTIHDLNTDKETMQDKRYKIIHNEDDAIILITTEDDEYFMTVYDDETYMSTISLDNLELIFEGYNPSGTTPGLIPTKAQPFLLIIPLFLIFGFIVLVTKDE